MTQVSSFLDTVQDDYGVFIQSLTVPDWKEHILSILRPAFVEPSGTPLDNLLELVKGKLKARTAVIEPYVSTDWNSEYSAVYSRIFQPPLHLAQRIHFFHDVVSYDNLYKMPKKLKDAYLGYAVMRPLENYRVGEAVLASPWKFGRGADLVHCLETFNTSLLGNHLTVKGMPFLQQDRLVGVCAQADLWMVSRYLNKRGETRRYRTAEIHSCATKELTVGPPRAGLLALQMTNALREFGLYPLLRSAMMDFKKAKELLYGCIESEIPVIAAIRMVGIGGHVVVVIGHDYSRLINDTVTSMSEAVGNFIVHDDSSTPYKKMETGSVPVDLGQGPPTDVLTLNGHQVDWFLIPFAPRVHMEGKEARVVANAWIQSIRDYVAGLLKIDKSELWTQEEMKNLVMRIYLRLSSSFKDDILSDQSDQLRNEKIIVKYKCMRMPKYIWVVELAMRSELQDISLYERKIRGEIILDSTGRWEAPERALIAFHLNGIMFIPGRRGKPSEVIVTEEAPYSPLMRTQYT